MTANQHADVIGALHEATLINIAQVDVDTARRVDAIIKKLRRALQPAQSAQPVQLRVVG